MSDHIQEFLKPGKKVFLSGIGGVSMAPLADVLNERGLEVIGSDLHNNVLIDDLRDQGVEVKIGEQVKENIDDDIDCIIRTAAVHDDNEEIIEAKAKGIPIFERAQAWGEIMKGYKDAICVAGTHGKTTTTSMLTQIFLEAGRDPSIMIGAHFPYIGSSHRKGYKDTIILESCEYCDSFLSFYPNPAVILNIDEDHIDYFKTLENIKKSFRKFALRTPEDGFVVANKDDANTVEALKGIDREVIWFGINNGLVQAQNIEKENNKSSFDVVVDGEFYTHVDLGVTGDYNMMNALAASAVAFALGIKPEVVSKALHEFDGAERRFEYKGEYNGAKFYDDYAHHPGELKSLLDNILKQGYKRVIVAFQPHLYSRTVEHFDEFVHYLSKPDVTVFMEIYPAREENVTGISSKDLRDKVPGSLYCSSYEEVKDVLKDLASPGDLIVSVGAGPIVEAVDMLLEESK